MIRGHKIRIYPTASQEKMLRQYVEAARFVYNWTVENWKKWADEKKEGRKKDNPTWGNLSKLWTRERPDWINKVPRVCVAVSIHEACLTFVKHFRDGKGWPKFKKKGYCTDIFRTDNQHTRIRKDGMHIHLPGVTNDIRLAEKLRFAGKILGFAVSTYAGKWYVSVQVETEDIRSAPDSAVGVDVGIKTPAVCSDGSTLTLPTERLKKLDKRLRKAQRVYSKRQKLSKRRARALRRKQRIQDKINNIRRDAIHKFTSAVCKNHETVVVEDLNARGLHTVPIKNIRSGTQRSCMSEVLRQLGYKAVSLVQADRWYPSTQLCSNCGHRQKMKLTQRVYNCPECGISLDRDLNAAINLSKYPGSLG